MRRSVYPGLVARGGRMTQAEADRRTDLMEEIAADYERQARIEAEAREPRLDLTERSDDPFAAGVHRAAEIAGSAALDGVGRSRRRAAILSLIGEGGA